MDTRTPIIGKIRAVWPWSSSPGSADAKIVARVKELAHDYAAFTEAEIRERANELRKCAVFASPRDTIEAVAVFKEAMRRTQGVEYYDVQLLGALAMARRSIAEMATGEGKTYVGAMASFLHGLAGKGVHLMTTNAYLAERDFKQVLPVFRKVGVSAGLLKAGDDSHQKQAAYACDVTYGPGYEFGFDYLRDQLALLSREKPKLGEAYRRRIRGSDLAGLSTMQRGLAVAIVDEADSVLLDEANTPLVLAGASTQENPHPEIYILGIKLASAMTESVDYVFADQRPKLTQAGASRAQAEFHQLGDVALYRPWTEYVEHALFALLRLRRNVHYIVADEAIQIVDDYTGRIFPERTWRGGLHQMVEAREGVRITPEMEPLARISRQQFFQKYARLCGMTGTAHGSERELSRFYRLSVSVIPTHRPNLRQQLPGRYFATANDKWEAIRAEVQDIHKTRQPILIGTRTIESSEELAWRLRRDKVSFQLLNGTQDAKEAAIVSRAGLQGAITVATNMAGRGTDIQLGRGVVELGGLHVIVAEPHDSRRVDRQLIGRAARQGNPGSHRSFAAADDWLIVTHANWLSRYMRDVADPVTGEVLQDLGKTIKGIQRKVEQLDFARRRRAFQHEAWLEEVMSELAESDR